MHLLNDLSSSQLRKLFLATLTPEQRALHAAYQTQRNRETVAKHSDERREKDKLSMIERQKQYLVDETPEAKRIRLDARNAKAKAKRAAERASSGRAMRPYQRKIKQMITQQNINDFRDNLVSLESDESYAGLRSEANITDDEIRDAMIEARSQGFDYTDASLVDDARIDVSDEIEALLGI